MASIDDAQADLIAEFELFDNWLDRYQYLIDLGRKLPAFPEEWKTEEFRLHGCQSQVWLRANETPQGLEFAAISAYANSTTTNHTNLFIGSPQHPG